MTSCPLDISCLVLLLVVFREGTTNAIGKTVPHPLNGDPRTEPGKRISCLLDKTQEWKTKSLWGKIKRRTTARPGLPGVGLSTEFMLLPVCRAQPAPASTGGS